MPRRAWGVRFVGCVVTGGYHQVGIKGRQELRAGAEERPCNGNRKDFSVFYIYLFIYLIITPGWDPVCHYSCTAAGCGFIRWIKMKYKRKTKRKTWSAEG